MTRPPSVLLIGDDELDPVRDVLEGVGVEVTHRRHRTVEPELALDRDLLVTTCRVALTGPAPFEGTSHWYRPVWVVLHNQDFLPLRERLRRLGVDYLVHSSANSEVLRLLLLRVLFCGTERRGSPRVPVGAWVRCEVEGRSWSSTLLEIGSGGCRIFAPEQMETGAPLTLELPPALGGGSAVRLTGEVIRVEPDRRRFWMDRNAIAIRFDQRSRLEMEALAALQTGRAIGTVVTRLADQPSDVAGVDAAGDEGRELPKSRRTAPRAALERHLAARFGEASCVILGRDLSVEGIRVEPRGDLQVGSGLQLAIPGAVGEEPLWIRSVVARDDGEHGLLLRFDQLEPKQRERLERIVVSLPPVDCLGEGERGSSGVIVMRKIAGAQS